LQLGSTGYLLQGNDANVVNLLSIAFWILDLVVLTGLTGASIGKFVSGVRVVRPDGRVCGIGRAILRWLLWIVDAFPYFAPLVGFITALSSQGNRRVGDMAAGTYVVRSSAVGQPVAVGSGGYQPGAAAPTAVAYGAPSADAQWDPARQAWIRWDGTAWTQHDPAVPGGWRPIS
jgi:hypothetical protein